MNKIEINRNTVNRNNVDGAQLCNRLDSSNTAAIFGRAVRKIHSKITFELSLVNCHGSNAMEMLIGSQFFFPWKFNMSRLTNSKNWCYFSLCFTFALALALPLNDLIIDGFFFTKRHRLWRTSSALIGEVWVCVNCGACQQNHWLIYINPAFSMTSNVDSVQRSLLPSLQRRQFRNCSQWNIRIVIKRLNGSLNWKISKNVRKIKRFPLIFLFILLKRTVIHKDDLGADVWIIHDRAHTIRIERLKGTFHKGFFFALWVNQPTSQGSFQ